MCAFGFTGASVCGNLHSKYRGPEKGRFSPDVETSHNKYVGPEKGRLLSAVTATPMQALANQRS
jgi:hypothetical protein